MSVAPSLRRATFEGGIALLTRQLISIALKLCGVLMIARVLGPESYGAYIAAFGIYGYASLIGQFGISVYLIRHAEPLPASHYANSYTVLAIIGLVLTLVVLAALPALSAWINIAGFAPVMVVLALALPAQLTAIPAIARLERALNFKTVAHVEVFAQLGFYAVAIPAIASGSGQIALAFAWLTQQILLCLAAHIVTRTHPVFAIDRKILRNILRYAVPYSLANWIWQIRLLVPPLIVAPALGAQAVGILGLTIGLIEMLSVVKSIVWRLSIAVLGRLQQDAARLRRAITDGMELQALALGAILLGFGWLGDWVVPVIFGSRWAAVMAIYPFIALAYFVNALFNLHASTLTLLGRNSDLARFHALHIILFAGASAVLVPQLGLKGYGWAELVALGSYPVLHVQLTHAVGTPDYRATTLWALGVAVGLFWRDLGWWAIAVPFLTLAVPPSPARLRHHAFNLTGNPAR